MIFDIKKFAIHDGPGIRTTVFFQGCPLDCQWCHNPECKSEGPSLYPELTEPEVVETVFREIRKDLIFFDQSGGGVTFSGGEPMGHIDLLLDLLKGCRQAGIHTAIDTCGYAEFEDFERIFNFTDLFLYDLKPIDDDQHYKYTSVSNRLILENLKRLVERNVSLRIRIPLIPGITDTEENLKLIAEYLVSIHSADPVDLLPFNLFGQSKYRKLGKPHPMAALQMQSDEQLEVMASIFRECGFEVKV